VFCLRSPDWVCHRATTRCRFECPHLIAECGEFDQSLQTPVAQAIAIQFAVGVNEWPEASEAVTVTTPAATDTAMLSS
jgi:hypothetical protein